MLIAYMIIQSIDSSHTYSVIYARIALCYLCSKFLHEILLGRQLVLELDANIGQTSSTYLQADRLSRGFFNDVSASNLDWRGRFECDLRHSEWAEGCWGRWGRRWWCWGRRWRHFWIWGRRSYWTWGRWRMCFVCQCIPNLLPFRQVDNNV